MSLTFHTRNEAWLNFSPNCDPSVKEKTLKIVTDLLSWETGANVKVSMCIDHRYELVILFVKILITMID